MNESYGQTKRNYVGKPARRVDAQDKVMGKARYVADICLPGMLFARALRSHLPHARIVRLDLRPAFSVPGVRAVITSEDFSDCGRFGFPVKDQYMLAYERVRHVGEAIAAVAADTPEAARAGVEAIICELEPLPGLFDPSTALDPDAPAVGPSRTDGRSPNHVDLEIVRKGDPLAVMADCPIVLDQTYQVGPQEHAYLETEGAIAIPTPEGGVSVYSSNQSPFISQGILSGVLGLPSNQVRIIQPPVGGSFGGKDDLNYQCSGQTAALALKTGRPVRMVIPREESLISSYKRDAMRMHVRLGADQDGMLRSCKFDGLMDSGAYASQSPFTAWRASIHAMGAYRYEACHVDIQCVYTNNGYAGAFRGFGNTEVCLAIEQAVDEIAEATGKDPMDLRLQNCLRVGDETPHGQVLSESVGLSACLRRAREMSDWDRKRSEYAEFNQSSTDLKRGIGVAALFHGSSLGAEGSDYAASTISVEPDDSITLTSGLTDYGTGSRTVYTLIAAEELGVEPSRLNVLRPDTDTALESGPTVASRATILGGNAIRIAARNLAQILDMAAANLLKCDLYQLVRNGEAFVGPSEEPVAWEVVVNHARAMGLMVSAQGKWTAPSISWNHHEGHGTPYFAYHFGTHVADVEVDVRTGAVKVVGFWATHDPGTVIFPQGAYGQVYGGVTQGLGYAVMEQINYVEGYLQETNYDSYLIPTSLDVPEIGAEFVEMPFSKGPYGAKNVAEPAMVPAAPAILNAIAHATGRRIRSLPANLERVLLGHDLPRAGSDSACKLGLQAR